MFFPCERRGKRGKKKNLSSKSLPRSSPERRFDCRTPGKKKRGLRAKKTREATVDDPGKKGGSRPKNKISALKGKHCQADRLGTHYPPVEKRRGRGGGGNCGTRRKLLAKEDTERKELRKKSTGLIFQPKWLSENPKRKK